MKSSPNDRQVNIHLHDWGNIAEWELHSSITDTGIFPIISKNGELLHKYISISSSNNVFFFKGWAGKEQRWSLKNSAGQ